MRFTLATSFVSLVIFFSLGLFSVVFAQGDSETGVSLASLAGCTGVDCTACHAVGMANGLIKWLIGFLFILFALIMAYAGFGLVTSGGNRHALDEAKGRFTNAIVGLIIVLAAWLVVDTIMRGLVGRAGYEGRIVNGDDVSGWLFWSEVQCYSPVVPDGDPWENRDEEYTPEEINNFLIDQGNGEAGEVTISTPAGPQVVGLTPCDEANMVSVNFLGGRVRIHKQFAPSLQRIDAAWQRQGANRYRVTSVGGYDCRKIAGSSRWSNHAYGLAVDINPGKNPHCPSNAQCGGKNILITDMPPEFRQLFLREGWGWGGNWSSSKDAMHYSKASGELGNMSGG